MSVNTAYALSEVASIDQKKAKKARTAAFKSLLAELTPRQPLVSATVMAYVEAMAK